jgi:hypothetical protein
MTVNNFAITARVRLTPNARVSQPEIGDTIGVVHGLGPGWVEVAWPGFRSWCKAGDLEIDP